MSYVAIDTGRNDYWKVGFYAPDGEWVDAPEDSNFLTHSSWCGDGYKPDDAKNYVNFLNGGK